MHRISNNKRKYSTTPIVKVETGADGKETETILCVVCLPKKQGDMLSEEIVGLLNKTIPVVRHSCDMITEEYIYKNEFRFQRMQKDGRWYITYNNHIITHGQYRHDLEEWIDSNYK